MLSRKKGQAQGVRAGSPGPQVSRIGGKVLGLLQHQAGADASGKEQAGAGGGFSVISLLGQGMHHSYGPLRWPPCAYRSVDTRRRRPELWWAGEVKLFHKRVFERDLFWRIGDI